MNAARPGRPAEASRSRLRAQLGLKITVLLGLAVGICVPYFSLQRLDTFPVRSVPMLPIDRWVGFAPAWTWAYASVALLVPLMPMLATTRGPLLRYASGLALLCGICFAFFLFLPVEGPRPLVAPESALYGFIVGVDRPANSMPSLHAGLVVYSFLFGSRVLREDLSAGGRAGFLLLSVCWGGAILYSTLATKQHWALDVPAGMAVAAVAHAWAWRGAR